MKIASFTLIAIAILFFSNGISIYSQEPEPRPFISEINFRGAIDPDTRCLVQDDQLAYESDTNFCHKDEWVEIYNPGEVTLDVSFWRIQLRNHHTITIPANSSIQPKTGFVVGYQDKGFRSVIRSKLDVQSFQMLYMSSDEADNISIRVLDKTGKIVDSLITNHSSIEHGAIKKGQSYYRCSGNDVWRISQSQINQQNFGTPKSDECPDSSLSYAPILNKNFPTPSHKGWKSLKRNKVPQTQYQRIFKPATHANIVKNPQTQTNIKAALKAQTKSFSISPKTHTQMKTKKVVSALKTSLKVPVKIAKSQKKVTSIQQKVKVSSPAPYFQTEYAYQSLDINEFNVLLLILVCAHEGIKKSMKGINLFELYRSLTISLQTGLS